MDSDIKYEDAVYEVKNAQPRIDKYKKYGFSISEDKLLYVYQTINFDFSTFAAITEIIDIRGIVYNYLCGYTNIHQLKQFNDIHILKSNSRVFLQDYPCPEKITELTINNYMENYEYLSKYTNLSYLQINIYGSKTSKRYYFVTLSNIFENINSNNLDTVKIFIYEPNYALNLFGFKLLNCKLNNVIIEKAYYKHLYKDVYTTVHNVNMLEKFNLRSLKIFKKFYSPINCEYKNDKLNYFPDLTGNKFIKFERIKNLKRASKRYGIVKCNICKTLYSNNWSEQCPNCLDEEDENIFAINCARCRCKFVVDLNKNKKGICNVCRCSYVYNDKYHFKMLSKLYIKCEECNNISKGKECKACNNNTKFSYCPVCKVYGTIDDYIVHTSEVINEKNSTKETICSFCNCYIDYYMDNSIRLISCYIEDNNGSYTLV